MNNNEKIILGGAFIVWTVLLVYFINSIL